MSQLKLKILVTRTDRLGDVLLCLPTLQYLRKALPDAELHFLCRREIGELLAPFLRKFYIKPIESEFTHVTILRDALRAERYRATLFLHPEWELLASSFWARIPKRVGPLSKPWCYFFLNKGMRQRRSRVRKNEAEYNLDLAKHLVKKVLRTQVDPSLDPITLPKSEKAADKVPALLSGVGIDASRGFLLVHPGMGGSAYNLNAASYANWIPELEKMYGIPAVLSEGPNDRDSEMTEGIQKAGGNWPVLRGLSLPLLMECLRSATLVAAPSTGPLHLAHYVGTKTIGIYSDWSTERKERWQPWGGSGQSTVITCERDGSFLELGTWREQLSEATIPAT